jgi:hypothetical protein
MNNPLLIVFSLLEMQRGLVYFLKEGGKSKVDYSSKAKLEFPCT